jgi:hypothetical protein
MASSIMVPRHRIDSEPLPLFGTGQYWAAAKGSFRIFIDLHGDERASCDALLHPRACSTPVLGNEFDAGGFQGASNGVHVGGRNSPTSLDPLHGGKPKSRGLSELAGGPSNKASGTSYLRR